MFNIGFYNENRQLFIHLKKLIILFLVLVDFVFIFLIAFFDLSYHDLYFMVSFDSLICVFLFIQLLFDYNSYDKDLKSFLKEHKWDIISMIPFNLILFGYLLMFRTVRFLQFVQIFRFVPVFKKNTGSLKYFVHNRLLKILAVIVFLYILLSSFVLKEIDPSFSTLFEAFWFNLVTVASVGYGDVTPLTDSGRVIAMCSIIMGIMFVSIFTAAMSAVYMEKPEEETRKQVSSLISEYVGRVKNDKEMLKKRIDELEKQNEDLNRKLDTVIELLEREK